jgi:lysophospholipase L1-like esterase
MATILTRAAKGSPLTFDQVDTNFINLNNDKAENSNLSASTGSSLVGHIGTGTGATSRTVQSKLRDTVSVKDFGADLTGVASSSTAFSNAGTASQTVIVPDGTYLISTDVTSASTFICDANVTFTGAGIIYAPVLKPSNSIYPARKKTLGDVLDKANSGTAITIACYGDSITYGQDTSATGVATQINGASQTRSQAPYPESLDESLNFAGFTGGVTVINRGFPGDTSLQGLTRWKSASATDVSILMYGHNDANNYGGTGLVTLVNFRRNMSLIIEREIAKGAAVIILSPPNVANTTQNNKIRPFAQALKQLADEYSIPYVDAVQQIATISNVWTDGVHLTSFAYCELGWNLAALFLNRDMAFTQVSSGDLYYPQDYIGTGGTYTINANAKGGALQVLTQTQTYAIGMYVESDCAMLIHSYNTTGNSPILNAYYSGGGSGIRGATNSSLTHVSANNIRQSIMTVPLKRGYRTIYIRNDSATAISANIEAIEFVDENAMHCSRGIVHKSVAMSGISNPQRLGYINSAQWFVAADFSKRLTAPFNVVANCKLSDTVLNGVAIFADRQSRLSNDLLNPNSILVMRSGSSLILRELVNGEPITDVTTTSVFPATLDWTGEIEIEMVADGNTLNIYVDGVLQATKNPTNKYGYAGMVSATGSKTTINSMLLSGYQKNVFN